MHEDHDGLEPDEPMGVITKPCIHGDYVARVLWTELWPTEVATWAVLIQLNAN